MRPGRARLLNIAGEVGLLCWIFRIETFWFYRQYPGDIFLSSRERRRGSLKTDLKAIAFVQVRSVLETVNIDVNKLWIFHIVKRDRDFFPLTQVVLVACERNEE